MRGQVPGAGSAHGKASDDHAHGIDRVLASHGGHGFEHIDLACELDGIAEPSVWAQDNGMRRRKLQWTGFALGKEGKLAALVAASSDPNFNPKSSPILGVRA